MSDFNYIDYDPIEIRKNLEKAYIKIVGNKITKGDPMSDFLDYIAYVNTMIYSKINHTGKMNLLRFATGEYVDALGEIMGEVRSPAKKALTTIKYKFSKTFESVVTIPKGHKTEAQGIYFETISVTQLEIGEIEVDIKCECTLPGEIGNGFEIGEIKTIVDGIPYLESVINITPSQGGAEEEGDDSLKEKIRMNPTARSVAGPAASYEYYAKKSHQDVIDVFVTSEVGSGIVKVYPLLKHGEIPEQDILNSIQSNLSDKSIKPLTDQVQTLAPITTQYDINLRYFIVDDVLVDREIIKRNVEKAIDEYIEWQHSKLGRDVNPSKLITLMGNAGAKRVEVIFPSFSKLERTHIAKIRNKTITYGGVEIE